MFPAHALIQILKSKQASASRLCEGFFVGTMNYARTIDLARESVICLFTFDARVVESDIFVFNDLPKSKIVFKSLEANFVKNNYISH